MAHGEPMDLDVIDCDFDNKENTFLINHALPKASVNEKGLENLDISDGNIKVQCSISQGSPMSKSFTANCNDGKNISLVEDPNIVNSNSNLTRSLNSTFSYCDGLLKSPKSLPLQSITVGSDKDRSITSDGSCHASKNNIQVNIDGVDMENLSIPSTCSSLSHTPEATTPTKEVPKDGGSPIMRGLKSVLSMFRSSQSQSPSVQVSDDGKHDHQETYLNSPTVDVIPQTETVMGSTLIQTKKRKSSPIKDSLTFNDDLQRELQWEEDCVFFKDEKVPEHILYRTLTSSKTNPVKGEIGQYNLNNSVEYMDISLNETVTADNIKGIEQTQSNIDSNNIESDSEFQDCETTLNSSEIDNKENKALTSNNSNEDIKTSNMEVGNMDASFSVTQSQQVENISESEKTFNTEVINKNVEEMKVTDLDVENTNSDIQLNLHNISETFNMIQTKLEYTEIDNVAIQLNETVTLQTLDNFDTTTPEIVNITADEKLVVDVLTSNNNCVNLPKELNKTINIDDNIQDAKTVEIVHKSSSLGEILVPSTHQASLVNFEPHKDKDSLFPDSLQELMEKNDIDNINFVETPSKSIEDIKNLSPTICLDNTHIVENNAMIQDNEIEACVEQENNSETDIEKECQIKTTQLLNSLSDIDNNIIQQIHENPVSTDLIPSDDQPEVIAKGDENQTKLNKEQIMNTDNNFGNIDNLENDIKSQDSPTAIQSSTICDTSEIPKEHVIECNDECKVRSNVIDNIDMQNNAEFTSIENNLSKDSIVESFIPYVQDNKCVTVNKNASDSCEFQNSSKVNAISILEPFHATKNEAPKNDHMVIDDSYSMQTEILNETREVIDECLPSSVIVNNHGLQHNCNSHIVCMETEEDVLSKDNSVNANDHSITEDESIKVNTVTISNLTETADNTISEDTTFNTNAVTNKLKPDCNLEIESKNLDPHLATNECQKNIQETTMENSTKPQEIHNNDLNQDDLEVESHFLNTKAFDSLMKTKSSILNTPPSSPKIESKGYNYNFDEIEDPFATKTNMRSSPPPTIPISENINNVTFETANIPNQKDLLQKNAKSESLPQEDNVCKMEAESTFTVSGTVEPVQNKDSTLNNFDIQKDVNESNFDDQVVSKDEMDNNNVHCNDRCEVNISYDINKGNVFNIPEIDDKNFSPFITRTKLRSTPPLVRDNFQSDDAELLDSDKNNDTVIVCKEDSKATPDDNDRELSKHADDTLTEVNTEDEDTIEGPFLDLDDLGEINKGDKIGDVRDDYMTFDDLSKQQTEEAENEMFIDAEAFEFLLNQNQANVVADSGKESLFLKFDPLFAKRISSDGIMAALTNFQKKQSTPKKEKQPKENNIPTETDAFPSCSKNVPTFDQIDESIVNNLSKPTMVVNPAVVPRMSTTPPKINRQSLTFTSPAMAVIDKLLSLSGNSNTSLCHNTSVQSCSEQQHTDVALTQLREMLAEKEMHVQLLRNERKELTSRLGTLESQVKTLEYESNDRLRKITDLNNELSEKNKQNRIMATVVEEYERTIATLVDKLDQDKRRYAEERMQLIKDRDEQTAHLASMEISFNDLHSKYEKSKQVILSLKSNEDTLKKSLQMFEESQAKILNNYELLKQHATAKLNNANQEFEKLNKAHEAEVLKLKAIMKRKDLHISSLVETLAQKTKANEELTAICDELINKVG